MRDFCNVGYARDCRRIPAERSSDSVRFAIAKDGGDSIAVQYSSERDHAPVEHGQLLYARSSSSWLNPHPDACIQRQAECYLATYLERKGKA